MRLDNIPAGSLVTLRFSPNSDPYEEKALFLGIEGEGDDREAKFIQRDTRAATYEWSAYRYNGRWAYGTGADRLQVLDHFDILGG